MNYPEFKRLIEARLFSMKRPLAILSCCLLAALSFAACAGGSHTDTTTNANASIAPNANGAAATSTAPAITATATAQQSPPEEAVRATAAPVQLARGGTAEAIVRLNIASGYHVNANPPTHSYLIATQVDVTASDGISAQQPRYPASVTRRFAFDPSTPLAVYEGEVMIRIPLRASREATPGARAIIARVRAQPCDDQACYQPRTIEISMPVTVH